MIKFDIEKTVQYWLDGAEYDMGVARAMFRTRKYPYALFMGHLALEKLLKALVVRNTRKHAPYTHSLSLLAEKLEIEIPKKIMKQLKRFMEFHFEARYPKEQMRFYKKCTEEFAGKKMKEIAEVYKWLIERL
jgi:HEPN domain-containing protein